ncbi:MAG: hypothetical protein FWE54_01635 [Methanimicrococcus sp.]|nr:hypothetical protein [Methanimicrococcus sp.]
MIMFIKRCIDKCIDKKYDWILDWEDAEHARVMSNAIKGVSGYIILSIVTISLGLIILPYLGIIIASMPITFGVLIGHKGIKDILCLSSMVFQKKEDGAINDND